MLIYTNHASFPNFEPPPSSRDVGYVLKERGGCGRVQERYRRPLMRETHEVRRGRCRNDDTFHDFYFATHPLSLPTTTQAGKTCRSAAHIHPRLRQLLRHPHLTPYRRNCEAAIGRPPPTPLAFNELAGVRVILGMYTLGRYELVGGLQRC